MARNFPDADTLVTVLGTAARAPSVQNSQPWRWRVTRDGVNLYADWSRQLGDADSDRRDVLLSCGAVLDHCVVALAAAGWRPRVRRFPEPDQASNLALIELVEMPASQVGTGPAIELAQAIPLRRTDRRPYSARPIPAGTLEMFNVHASRSGVRLSVVPKIRWAPTGDDDITLRYGGEPRAGNNPETQGAAMVVLGTDTDTDLMRLRAGEMLSHISLSSTVMGLATCPLTDPLKDARNRLALACEVFDGDAVPQTLIRIGWPPSDGSPSAPVERRSLAETTAWDSDEIPSLSGLNLG